MPVSHPTTAGSTSTSRLGTPIHWAALAVAAMFLLLGVLGFIPGVTADYDQLNLTGHHSGAALLGIMHVSILRNVVHLAFGIVGVVLARTFAGSRKFLIGGGLVYLVIFFYGLVVDHDSTASVLPVNDADNWLHLGISVSMIAIGVILSLSRFAPVDPAAEGDGG